MSDDQRPTSITSFRARWVVPVASPPIDDGRVRVENGRIVAVEKARGSRPGERDLGDVVLLPAFINAHTHLALTAYHGQVPHEGSFIDWVERLVALRSGPASGPQEAESLARGIAFSRRAGVAALCDIGYRPEAIDTWCNAPLGIVGCLEVLGIGGKAAADHPAGVEKQLELVNRYASAPAALGHPLTRLGLSPHAPYSTAEGIYRRVVEYAQRTGCLVTTHLAETREEHQFLRDGTGSFRDLLEKWNLWDGTFRPPGCSPVQYARELELLALRPILAHVNYADDTDLDLLRRAGAHVAYCPRTHAFFGHRPHRYAEMLRRGINVCLGTDSLAGNDTLSILDELRFLRQHASPLTDHELLELATINGARALRLDHTLGTLEPGKRADMIALPLLPETRNSPLDNLWHPSSPPHTVIQEGTLLSL